MSYWRRKKKVPYKKRDKVIRNIDNLEGNNISSFHPDASLMNWRDARELPLPSGVPLGPKWGYLINHIQAYKVAKQHGNYYEMNLYASAIHNIRAEMGLPDNGWPPVAAEYDTRREQTFS